MAEVLGWSDLPEELVDLFSNDRLSSNIDFLRIRSICKPWRSAVATKKRFSNRFQRNLPYFRRKNTFVSPTTFFRVTLPSSSCTNKGWLIKTRQVAESSKYNLLSPLSGKLITPSDQTLDLMKFGVSEIRQSYSVQYLTDVKRTDPNLMFLVCKSVEYKSFEKSTRVVLLNNLCFVVYDNEIWCCKIGDESKRWTRIKNDEVESFLDITLHRGQIIYALDLKGAIWWFSLSELSIYKYGPSTPLDYYDFCDCNDKRLVEYCGDICVIHRFYNKIHVKGVRTIGFRVYKMDKDLVDWVEVNDLGDKALIVAADSCFTVVASDYYGCLENAIYFNDGEDVSVFKLDDGCIVTKQIDSSSSSSTSQQSCFQIFSAPFL